jgi:exodeoxyribonuclease III
VFRFVSLNLNGLRSAANKGLLPWVHTLGADCMGLQELRVQADQVEGQFDGFQSAQGYLMGHFHFAQKKGYSGVGLYSRHTPSAVIVGLNQPDFDAEGRYVELRYDTQERRLSLISCYFPSGSSSPERQAVKFLFLEHMTTHLKRLSLEREFILAADINIAHHPIDLKNWRGNQKNSGFLPEERAWMTQALSELKLVDVFRALHPEKQAYTWWSNRGQARANNVGWRIDYQSATPKIAALAKRAEIYRDTLFSDHAPVIVDYDFSI